MMSKRLPQILSRDDILRLISSCPETFIGHRNRTALILAYRCGLRVSEICNLSIDDVRFSDSIVRVRQGKGGKDRSVPFDPETDQLLRDWMKVRSSKQLKYETVWFLVTRDGKKTCPRTYQYVLAELSQATGIYLTDGETRQQVHPHVLRHSFATEMLDEGFNIREVQQVLGHANLQTTMIYTEVRLPELREKFARRERVLCQHS